MRVYLIIIASIFFSLSISAQIEICNNSIDDDGDGLIDIQDSDCDCDQILPSGLIPNESFEIMECCPTGEADFQCATSWQQAPVRRTFNVLLAGSKRLPPQTIFILAA